MREIELARAAGFFNGEGTTCFIRTGRGNLIVAIHQVDPRELWRFCSAVGRGKVHGPYPHRGGIRLQYQWAAWGQAAVDVITTLWPYLSDAKREQAQRAKLAYTASREEIPDKRKRRKLVCKWGHSMSGDNVTYWRKGRRVERACLACQREKQRRYYHAKRARLRAS